MVEAGVGGTTVVALLGVGTEEGMGVRIWLPSHCGIVSLAIDTKAGQQKT